MLVTGGQVINDLLQQDVSDTQHMPSLMQKFKRILSSKMAVTYFSVITVQPSKSILSSVKLRLQFRNNFAFWGKENQYVTLAKANSATKLAHTTAFPRFQIIPMLFVAVTITNVRI